MNKLVTALALAAAVTACQQKPVTIQVVPAAIAASPAAWKAAVDTFAARAAKNGDLSRLWAGGEDLYRHSALDGFFGAEHRRISFMFTDIHRDAQQPTLYHIAGKNLYNKTVSAFKGTIAVTSFTRLDQRKLAADEMLDIDPQNPLYSATAKFIFQEYPATSPAGAFSGTAHLDFMIERGKPQLARSMNFKIDTPTQGAGVLYQGQWGGGGNAPAKALLLSGDPFITAPEALANFSISDRGHIFNPKYAKLGWNGYWANDEWWTEEPKSQASL